MPIGIRYKKNKGECEMKYSSYYEYVPGQGCVRPEDFESIENVSENTTIWACAYETTSTKENMSLKCMPVKGIISDKYFIPYKKNGGLKMSGRVKRESRSYADTYEECVEMYNFFVNKRMEQLQKLLEESAKDLLNKEDS